MHLAVIGAGAIGGWLSAGFIEAGASATVLARGATLETLRRTGLGLDDGTRRRSYTVEATDDPSALRGADVLLLGVKAHDLPGLAPVLRACLGPDTLVVPAINGLPWWFLECFGGPARGMVLDTIDPGGVLAALMPADRVVGAVVHAGSRVVSPGNIRLEAANRVWLGDAGQSANAQRIAALLEAGGIPAAATERIHHEVWSKLWGNSNMNPLSALSRADLTQMLDDDGIRGLTLSMMREMSALGERIGLTGFRDFDERIAATRKLGAFRTSMLQDIEAGRPIEIDPILGALVELARRLDHPVPVMEGICALTRMLDRNLRAGRAT